MGNDQSGPREPRRHEYEQWDASVPLRLDVALYGVFPAGCDVSGEAFAAHARGQSYHATTPTLVAWRACAYSGGVIMEGPSETVPLDPLLPVLLVLRGVNPAHVADVTQHVRTAILHGQPALHVMNKNFHSVDPQFGAQKSLFVCATPRGARQSRVLSVPEYDVLQLAPAFAASSHVGSYGNELTKAALRRSVVGAAARAAAEAEAAAAAALATARQACALRPALLQLGLLPGGSGGGAAAAAALRCAPGGGALLAAVAAAMEEGCAEGERARAKAALRAARKRRRAADAAVQALLREEWSYDGPRGTVMGAGVEAGELAEEEEKEEEGEEEVGSPAGSSGAAAGGSGSGSSAVGAGGAAAGGAPVAAGSSGASDGSTGSSTGSTRTSGGSEAPAPAPEPPPDTEVAAWVTPPASRGRLTLGSPPHQALPLALAEAFALNDRIDSLGPAVAWTVRRLVPDVNAVVAQELVAGLSLECAVGVNRAGKPLAVQIKVGGKAPIVRIALV